MKKSLIALAVLAASGAAMAQSSVTLFGVVDAGVGRISADKSVSGVTNSGLASSRLGFRGEEDLGGGLKAGFWLEGAIQNDDGSGKGAGAPGPGFEFKRRSTVSLIGAFGEVRLGRELAVGYENVLYYDPFGTIGVGGFLAWSGVPGQVDATSLGQPARVSNGVSYHTPSNLGGFFAHAHYAFGETPSGSAYSKAGNYMALAGGYENGPLSVSLAADKLRGPVATGAAGDVSSFSIGASYDLGVVKPSFIWNQQKLNSNPEVKQTNYLIGLTAPVGPGSLKASYGSYDRKNSNNDSSVLAVGYVYNLSKRTAVYGTYAYLNNKAGAARVLGTGGLSGAATAVGENVNGYQVGIRHAF